MYTQNKQNIIIKNSNGDTYYFYLDNAIVSYEKYSNKQVLIDTNTLAEDKIIDFSADIDKNDRIHVLCLTNEGKLIYYLNANEKWSNSVISKFDIKSNIYRSLSLRINNDNLHIMYAYSNLINSSVWTIQHIMGVKNKWEKMNIISVTTGKSPPYFKIDFDKFNNIHMVYKSKLNGKENIYYTSFNILLKKWNQFPQQISDLKSDNTSPYLLADSNDNIHIIWCTSINDVSQLAYKHLPSLGSNKFRWKAESLPVYSNNISNPIIYEDKGLIKILFNTNNLITSIYSNDSGFTWKSDNTQNIKFTGDLEVIKYTSNYQIEKNKYKVYDLFINIENSFIELPKILLNKNEITKVEKNESSNIYSLQREKIEQSHSNETVSILENLDEFKDDLIKDFVTNTKNDFEAIASNDYEIKELKAKIEKIIFNNSLCLDQKIVHCNNYFEELIAQLDNLEKMLEQCKTENESLIALLDSVKKVNLNRENTVLLVESKISQIKEIIRTESNKSMIKKILSVFRKDT